MNINANIRKYLKKKGITEVSLAEKMDTTRQNINRILNDYDIKWSMVEKIALALEVSPKIFLEDLGISLAEEPIETCGKKIQDLELEFKNKELQYQQKIIELQEKLLQAKNG